jgi:NADPH-dependent 7-cyano-7-deazaguanine reductase QueF-like protein
MICYHIYHHVLYHIGLDINQIYYLISYQMHHKPIYRIKTIIYDVASDNLICLE